MTPFLLSAQSLFRHALAKTALALGLAAVATPALACPEYQLMGQRVSVSASQLMAPQSLPVIAGGRNDLSQCRQLPGYGYVATPPDFDLSLSGMGGGAELVLQVTAQCDSVLLVNDWSGTWHFDDDGGDGLNARIVIPAAGDGVYDIWVGTYEPATCQANLTLQVNGTMPPSCQQGQVLVNGVCQASIVGQDACPQGQVFFNGTCMPDPCPEGYGFVNGGCQPEVQQLCPQGLAMVNGRCQPEQPAPCPQGQVMLGGSCVNDPCPQGFSFANGSCQATGVEGPGDGPSGDACPPGQQRILGVCQNPSGEPIN